MASNEEVLKVKFEKFKQRFPNYDEKFGRFKLDAQLDHYSKTYQMTKQDAAILLSNAMNVMMAENKDNSPRDVDLAQAVGLILYHQWEPPSKHPSRPKFVEISNGLAVESSMNAVRAFHVPEPPAYNIQLMDAEGNLRDKKVSNTNLTFMQVNGQLKNLPGTGQVYTGKFNPSPDELSRSAVISMAPFEETPYVEEQPPVEKGLGDRLVDQFFNWWNAAPEPSSPGAPSVTPTGTPGIDPSALATFAASVADDPTATPGAFPTGTPSGIGPISTPTAGGSPTAVGSPGPTGTPSGFAATPVIKSTGKEDPSDPSSQAFWDQFSKQFADNDAARQAMMRLNPNLYEGDVIFNEGERQRLTEQIKQYNQLLVNFEKSKGQKLDLSMLPAGLSPEDRARLSTTVLDDKIKDPTQSIIKERNILLGELNKVLSAPHKQITSDYGSGAFKSEIRTVDGPGGKNILVQVTTLTVPGEAPQTYYNLVPYSASAASEAAGKPSVSLPAGGATATAPVVATPAAGATRVAAAGVSDSSMSAGSATASGAPAAGAPAPASAAPAAPAAFTGGGGGTRSVSGGTTKVVDAGTGHWGPGGWVADTTTVTTGGSVTNFPLQLQPTGTPGRFMVFNPGGGPLTYIETGDRGQPLKAEVIIGGPKGDGVYAQYLNGDLEKIRDLTADEKEEAALKIAKQRQEVEAGRINLEALPQQRKAELDAASLALDTNRFNNTQAKRDQAVKDLVSEGKISMGQGYALLGKFAEFDALENSKQTAFENTRARRMEERAAGAKEVRDYQGGIDLSMNYFGGGNPQYRQQYAQFLNNLPGPVGESQATRMYRSVSGIQGALPTSYVDPGEYKREPFAPPPDVDLNAEIARRYPAPVAALPAG